jgi:hypothetical protein
VQLYALTSSELLHETLDLFLSQSIAGDRLLPPLSCEARQSWSHCRLWRKRDKNFRCLQVCRTKVRRADARVARWDRSAPGASVGLFRSRPGPVIVERDTRRGLAVDAQRSTPNGALAWGPIATGPVLSPNSPRGGLLEWLARNRRTWTRSGPEFSVAFPTNGDKLHGIGIVGSWRG